jgi:hypothetical protein
MALRTLARPLLAAMMVAPAVASAQAFRTYVASHGTDGPTCSISAPCRLLPAALAAVADGGEVWMLDSANYNTGMVQITKSVTILAVPGALGSVVATSVPAIQIATPGVEATLRNLVVVPLPGATAVGLSMYQGAVLTVQDCTFADLPTAAIYAENGMVVRVMDSTFRGNGYGLGLKNGVRATVTGSNFSGNGGSGIDILGISVDAPTLVDVADSTLDGNGYYGLSAFSLNGSTVTVSVRDSRVVGNMSGGLLARSDASGGPSFISASDNLLANNDGPGLDAFFAGSRIWASGNSVVGNAVAGIRNVNAAIESAGTNAVRNNAAPEVSGPFVAVGTE